MTKSELLKKRWENPEYREAMRLQSMKLWEDENYINKATSLHKTVEYKKTVSERFKGKKLSEEEKIKRQQTNSNKSISIDGVEYKSIAESARVLKVNRSLIRGRLISQNYPNYIYLDGTDITKFTNKNNNAIKYREIHPEKIKNYYQNNQERLKEYRRINKDKKREYQLEYNEKNKDIIRIKKREYIDKKRKTDIVFKLSDRIRTLISNGLKKNGYTKKSRTFEILGCSYENFKLHLEGQFEPWMNWDNYGKYNNKKFKYGWDIDHVIPSSSGKTEEEILTLNHYTNLQPLCSKINRDIKRDRVDY